MRIFTSRYSNPDLANRPDLVKVRISVGAPRFKLGYEVEARVHELMPEGWMVKQAHSGTLSREKYESFYTSTLSEVGYRVILNRLLMINVVFNRDLVLLCFEDLRKPGAWCHRTMAAAWLESHGMGEVEELEATS